MGSTIAIVVLSRFLIWYPDPTQTWNMLKRQTTWGCVKTCHLWVYWVYWFTGAGCCSSTTLYAWTFGRFAFLGHMFFSSFQVLPCVQCSKETVPVDLRWQQCLTSTVSVRSGWKKLREAKEIQPIRSSKLFHLNPKKPSNSNTFALFRAQVRFLNRNLPQTETDVSGNWWL